MPQWKREHAGEGGGVGGGAFASFLFNIFISSNDFFFFGFLSGPVMSLASYLLMGCLGCFVGVFGKDESNGDRGVKRGKEGFVWLI
jgi:hypothetical protein